MIIINLIFQSWFHFISLTSSEHLSLLSARNESGLLAASWELDFSQLSALDCVIEVVKLAS